MRWPRAAALALTLALAGAAGALGAGPAAAAGSPPGACAGGVDSCHGRAVVTAGDDGFDAGLYYAGPGGLARRVPRVPSSCPGCAWEATAACDANRPGDDPANGRPSVNCARAASACPRGQLTTVWVRRPGEPFRPASTVCVPVGSEVVTPRRLAPDAAAAFRHLALPPPRPVAQPAGRAVSGLPVAFHAAGQPAYAATVTVRGFALRLVATPEQWLWQPGDGSPPLAVATPGAPYPRHAASHSYRRPGRYDVTLRVRWRGDYTLTGAGTGGPVALADRVERGTSLALDVAPARARLVGG